MKHIVLFLALILGGFTINAQAPNDECVDRETITVNTTDALEYAIDTSTATETLDASCEFAGSNNLDVWYEFTMPVNGNIRVTNIPSTVNITLFDSCGGSEITCFNNDGFIFDLQEATTYVLRVAENSTFAGPVNFRVQAFETAPNDECADRETITVNTTDALEYATNTATATESIDTSCENVNTDNLDVWYQFTMPVNGNVRVTNIPSSVNVSIFDACGGSEIACFNNDGFIFNLAEMTDYVLRIGQTAFSANQINFRVQAFETAPNDECIDRETITVNTIDALEYAINIATATESIDSSCENVNTDNLDVWYQFTMPVNGNVRVTNIASSVNVSLFDTCGGSEITCFNNDGFMYDLQETTDYVLRISQTTFSAGQVNFRVQAFEKAPNDECVDRETITVNTTGALDYTINIATATESIDASCENINTDNLDVWYEFTMPVNGNVRITDIPSSFVVSLFDACGGSELGCFGNDGFFYDLQESTTYVLRASQTAFSAGTFTFGLQAFETPTNDECATPTTIQVLQETTTVIPVDNRGATESIDASCDTASTDNLDLWYTFTMPVNGTVEISNVASSEGFSLFDECSGEELGCFYNDGSFFELINGNSYILRVSKNAFSANAFDFTIQAVETTPQPCSDSTIWDGNTWSNGVPDNTKSALFNGSYNTSFDAESINACSCTIASAATVTIGDGFYLRSVFDITVEGTLNISHQGSLVQVAEDAVAINNGDINVIKTTPSVAGRNFIALSSPMSGESRDQVYGSARAVFGIIPANFVPFDIDLMEFPEFAGAENFLDDNLDYLDEYTGTRDLPDAGIGLLVFPSSDDDAPAATYNLTYDEGTLNSGMISVPINYNGPETTNNYNLLGNPYASAIDVNAFITGNDAVNEVYYWEHITNPSGDLPGFGTSNFSMNDISIRNALVGISAVNGGTSPGQFMASGQGFAIKADQAQAMSNTPVTFTNSIRVTGDNDDLRSAETTDTDLIWFNLTTNAYEDAVSQTAVGFIPQATPGFDPGYDSVRLGTFISLFTTLETGEQLAIQGREVFHPEIALTLGFSTTVETEETYTISIHDFQGINISNVPVFLIDQMTSEIVNLKETDFTFTAQRGIQPERFTIVFQERDALNIEDVRFRESITLYPNPATDQFTLTYAGQSQLQQLTIVDVQGKLIKTITLQDFTDSKVIDTSALSKGMYFIQIQSDSTTIIQKLMIR